MAAFISGFLRSLDNVQQNKFDFAKTQIPGRENLIGVMKKKKFDDCHIEFVEIDNRQQTNCRLRQAQTDKFVCFGRILNNLFSGLCLNRLRLQRSKISNLYRPACVDAVTGSYPN